MCTCPEPEVCEVCGSMSRVCMYQGTVICEKCLIKGANYASS